MLTNISRQSQLTHSLPRSFFTKNYMLTDIDGVAHFDTSQVCDLMEITPQNWSQRMAARASSDDQVLALNASTCAERKYQNVYEIPVHYQSTSDTGRGG